MITKMMTMRHRDHVQEPLLRAHHVLVLAAPRQAVAGRQRDAARHGLLRSAHVGADVDPLEVDIDPGVRPGVLGLDRRRPFDVLTVRELPERNLLPGGRGDEDVFRAPAGCRATRGCSAGSPDSAPAPRPSS